MASVLSAAGISDANQRANALLDEYGSLNAILSAQTLWIDGIAVPDVSKLIGAIGTLMDTAIFEQAKSSPSINSLDQLHPILRRLVGHGEVEKLVALHLDSGRRLLAHDVIATGDQHSVDFDMRKILLHALSRGASGLIIAHNHPSGDPQPSQADRLATAKLANLAQNFGITLHDHVVIAGPRMQSAM